jgi:hypothetical protein
MFRYQEQEYEIEKCFIIQSKDGEQIVEIRAAKLEPQWVFGIVKRIRNDVPSLLNMDRNKKYISIKGENLDILLLYRNGSEEEMNLDWSRIVSEPDVKVNELKWFEKVSNHEMGVTRDGCVIIY